MSALKNQDTANHSIVECHSPHVLTIASPYRGTRAIVVGVILNIVDVTVFDRYFDQSRMEIVNTPECQLLPVRIYVPWLTEKGKEADGIDVEITRSELNGQLIKKKLNWVYPVELGFTPTTYLIEICRGIRDHQFIGDKCIKATIHFVIF